MDRIESNSFHLAAHEGKTNLVSSTILAFLPIHISNRQSNDKVASRWSVGDNPLPINLHVCNHLEGHFTQLENTASHQARAIWGKIKRFVA